MPNSFLRSEIEADIAVRERNLTLLKTIPYRYSFIDSDKGLWSRCVFPIIYAEWEGFFVSAFSIYFREINKLGLVLDDLDQHYFVREAEKKFKQLKNYPEKIDKKHSFLMSMLVYFRDTSQIALCTDVNTESNLGFNVVNTVLSNLNLKTINDHIYNNEYSLKEKLDRFLLDTRNGIAHGNHEETITADDIDNAINLVKILMSTVMDILEDGFNNQVYRKRM